MSHFPLPLLIKLRFPNATLPHSLGSSGWLSSTGNSSSTKGLILLLKYHLPFRLPKPWIGSPLSSVVASKDLNEVIANDPDVFG